MTFSHFADALETIRHYGMEIIFLCVSALVFLVISGSIIASLFEPDTPPEPPVYHGDHPRSDKTGCVMVGGLNICPREQPVRSEGEVTHTSFDPFFKTSNVEVRAGKNLRVSIASFIFGEKRSVASQDVVRAVRIVAQVLQADKSIDVYFADFKNGPAAYARLLILKQRYEIVFSKNYIPASDANGRLTWPFMGLVAHEVSHTIYNEGLGGDRMSNEASAEYQAGVAIYRLGGNLEESFEFSAYFSGTSDVHPNPDLSAILSREGWYQEKARHEGTAGTCQQEIVGHRFSYKQKTCHYVLSCSRRKRPIHVACETDSGSWNFQ